MRSKQNGVAMLPQDFDPEDLGPAHVSEDSEDDSEDLSSNEDNGRSHYLKVDASSLRKSRPVDLGPSYSGAIVSRTTMNGDMEVDSDDGSMSDDPFAQPTSTESKPSTKKARILDQGSGENESEDEEESDAALTRKIQKDQLDGSRQSSSQPSASSELGFESEEEASTLDSDLEEEEDSDGFGSADDMSDEDGISSAQNSSAKDDRDREAFRKIARQDQGNLLQSLSIAKQADTEKGKAVQKQRTAFQTLLSTRMRLQKGLIAANTFSSLSDRSVTSVDDRKIIESAERAALSLLNSIGNLRAGLATSADGTRGVKRPFEATLDTPIEKIHSVIERSERAVGSSRKSVLSRWAEKTAPVSSLVKADRLRNVPSQQPLVQALDGQLVSPSIDRLISRTKVPRSCAPAQAKTVNGGEQEEQRNIYDDADWYALLLRDLVESKMNTSSSSNPTAANDATSTRKADNLPSAAHINALHREARTHRANVDVKASKGRKLRYTVQDRIQNFLVPEDRTTWGEKQVRELFGSLMGRRIQGGLLEDGDEDGEEENSGGGEVNGLVNGHVNGTRNGTRTGSEDDEDEDEGGEEGEQVRNTVALRLFGQ